MTDPLDALVEAVLQSPKYRSISPELVRALGSAFVRGDLSDPDLIRVMGSTARGTREVIDAATLQRPRAYVRRGAPPLLVMGHAGLQ